MTSAASRYMHFVLRPGQSWPSSSCSCARSSSDQPEDQARRDSPLHGSSCRIPLTCEMDDSCDRSRNHRIKRRRFAAEGCLHRPQPSRHPGSNHVATNRQRSQPMCPPPFAASEKRHFQDFLISISHCKPEATEGNPQRLKL